MLERVQLAYDTVAATVATIKLLLGIACGGGKTECEKKKNHTLTRTQTDTHTHTHTEDDEKRSLDTAAGQTICLFE